MKILALIWTLTRYMVHCPREDPLPLHTGRKTRFKGKVRMKYENENTQKHDTRSVKRTQLPHP